MHFTICAIFALLGSATVKSAKAMHVLALAVIAYSSLMEIGQYFLPGRSMSALDLLANALGVLPGLALVKWLNPQLR